MFSMINTIVFLGIELYFLLANSQEASLHCYNCTDCLIVDINTTTVDDCGGCTTQFLESSIVRGCVSSCINDIVQGPFCCTENLCNNQKLSVHLNQQKQANIKETNLITNVSISSSLTSSIVPTMTLSTTTNMTTITSEMKNSQMTLNKSCFIAFNCLVWIFLMLYIFPFVNIH
ncbi:hypothetical protein MN116_002946 [Schistosoma mekongi]|uniref:UPAR/Ly6 domain-containing protein n=1 Tax=Schistosoma mekongi TaxID=38744 RepID=A0AAE2D730_SCHME|nr:hypothetical protein MN116_002946 [Schistosoma mekongi]